MAFKVNCVWDQSAELSSLHLVGLQLSYREKKRIREREGRRGRERPDDICNNVGLQCKVWN